MKFKKLITEKQVVKALRKRTEADLIISQYNLQESKRTVELINEAKSIAFTFQNGSKSDSECFAEAVKYLKSLHDKK